MKYTIYRVTNKINGKVYIGSHKTKNLNDNYMGSGKYLNYSISKHGIKNFEKEILHVFDTPEEMYAKEAEIVTKDFIAESNTYNLKVGGFGGFDYINENSLRTSISDEAKEKLSELQRNRMKDPVVKQKIINNLWRGNHAPTFTKKHTAKSKTKISLANKGKRTGKANSQYGTCWMHNNRVSKKIEKSELEQYLVEGWIKGRKIKF